MRDAGVDVGLFEIRMFRNADRNPKSRPEPVPRASNSRVADAG